jgi:hypothetical protein
MGERLDAGGDRSKAAFDVDARRREQRLAKRLATSE